MKSIKAAQYACQTTPPELQERNRKIIKLRKAGLTMTEIARAIGLSYQRVQQILARENRAA